MPDGETIRLIALGTITAFGGAGFWSWISSRHKPIIERETSAVLASKELISQALAIAQRADERSLTLETEVQSLRADIVIFAHWAQNLIRYWHVIRRDEDPPTLPNLTTVTDADEKKDEV